MLFFCDTTTTRRHRFSLLDKILPQCEICLLLMTNPKSNCVINNTSPVCCDMQDTWLSEFTIVSKSSSIH
jgi:hypothetical protein